MATGVEEPNRKNEGAFCWTLTTITRVAALEVDRLRACLERVSNEQIGQVRHIVGVPDVKARPEICKQAHDEPNPLKILLRSPLRSLLI